jgi:dTDP-4-dehydrorhamnose 3,5-epimerase
MIFTETPIAGAYLVDIERVEDERGFFARSWCRSEAQANGLNPRVLQCSVSFSARQGTLRGLHYQVAPFEEAKQVRCTRGALYDVVVDLRSGSPTFRRWFGALLTADNRTMLYVPEGVAHGFLTMVDDTEVFYQISEFYAPECARGVRWDDPAFGIEWPARPLVISDRDRSHPDFISPEG